MDDYNLTLNTNVTADEDGGPNNPLEMDIFTLVIHCTCSIVGLPLNTFIAAKILCSNRLKSKPKYIFLFTLVLCNIFTLVTAVDEIVYFFYPNESVCRFFISINELPYCLFFFNLLLALIDRYVAMDDPIWHHQKVTIRFVIFWIGVLNAVLALALNWAYISGVAQLSCRIDRNHANTLDATLLVLCVSCITFKIIDYVKTKKLLPGGTTSIVVTLPNRSSSANGQQIEMVHIVSTNEQRLNIHIGSAALSRLQNQATRTCMVGVIRLLLLPCPLLAFTFSHLICTTLVYPGSNQCDDITRLSPYFKELITFHAVVHPVVFLLRSNDFFSPTQQPGINLDELYG